MNSIDLQQQQQKAGENNMLPISNSGNSKEFCIAALLVPPIPPLDNDDDKTPTIKNHKAEAGPFDKDDNDIPVIISVNHPSESQNQHIRANSIQSKESDVIMEAINNDDGMALKETRKEPYYEKEDNYGIHNYSEKSLETMSGNYETRKEEEEERCHADDSISIGQSSHHDTNDRNPSSIEDAELLDKAASDDEVTTQEPLETNDMDKGHLHPETSYKNSYKENTSLLLNDYTDTMMICEPKADTDNFSKSTLEGDVTNAFLDQEQLAVAADELNLLQSLSLQGSLKDEDKETKDCTGTNVKVNLESKNNMPTSEDPNDALTEVSSVRDNNVGCTTEHVSDDGYEIGKQDVNKTNFISEAEEDSLQDQIPASKTNMQVTAIAPADVGNMSLNKREPNIQDKSKETLDHTTSTDLESKDNMPTSEDPNDALTDVSSVKDSNACSTTEHVSDDGYEIGKQDVNKTNFISEAEEDSLQDQIPASKTNMQVTTIAPADVDNMSLNKREPNIQDKSKETLDHTTNTDVNILIESCNKIPTNAARTDADTSFCTRMSTEQCTEQPATFAGVLDHEDVCIHGNNFGTERQNGLTSPESEVSVINSNTTVDATAVESRSKHELDPPVADTNLAAEIFHDQEQLTDTAEVYKLRQNSLEGKVIDSQTYSTNTDAHVLSKVIDNKRMIENPSSVVAQIYSFTIVRECDAGDTIERSSEGCSNSTTNINEEETTVKQTMLDRDNGQIRLNDEHFDNRPILSRSAVIESLDVTTVQPPARTDHQGKPETSIDNNDNNDDRRESKSLLQEAIECLAESNLIYLLADLRLLSATGRIYTPYETINIDSDFIPKESVATLTASPSSRMFSSGPRTDRTAMKGISPAHIIAVMLIELRKEFNFASRNYNKSTRGDSVFSAFTDSVGHNMHRKHMISSMLWYSDMITKDLLPKVPKIRSKALRSHTKITTSMILERWQTLVKQNKDAINSLFPVRHTTTTAAAAAAEADDNFEHNSFNDVPKKGRPSLSPRVNSAPVNRLSRTQLLRSSRKVAQSILNNIQDKISDMKDDNTKEKRQIKNLLDEFFDLGVDYTLSEEELLDFMEKAVMSRVHDKFQFLSEFFQEDTITKAMVESKSKVVWLQDWYPLKELTYSISVNQEKKRVLVVFRGCTTVSDWKHALDARWKTTPNPVKEDFRGKKDLIKLHRGFFLYLFRSRKDNDTCKYDEIANVTHWYGKQIGDNYEVVATGHSLGAAMATLFSFYASADERFTKLGPVKCITFASPMVGGQAFADSFRHQERNKKLMLARFHNATDMCKSVH
jgi:hypothetical protein